MALFLHFYVFIMLWRGIYRFLILECTDSICRRAEFFAGAGDINTAGNRTTFTDEAEEKTPHTKSMSKNA